MLSGYRTVKGFLMKKNLNLLLLIFFASLLNPAVYAGMYDTYTIYAVGAQAKAVVIGDINSDGRNDAVVVSSFLVLNTNGLCVFTQNESGTLNPAVIYSCSSYPSSLAIGDLNSDGKADVAVANSDLNNIGVFMQNNTGTLDAQVLYPVGVQPDSIKIGDVNGDGKNDVIASNAMSNYISVLIQAGGVLAAQATYSVNSYGDNKIDIGDMNNDGLSDVVLMRGRKSGIENIAVFPQNGSGTLDTPVYHSVSGSDTRVYGMAVGSINGDTLADVVTDFSLNTEPYISVFIQGNTDSLDTSPVDYTAYNSPSSVAISDISGDGKDDVVILHDKQGKMSIYKQNTSSVLSGYGSYSLPYSGSYNPHSIALGDINSDSVCEILIADEDYGLIVMRQIYCFSFVAFPASIVPNKASDVISVHLLNGDSEKASTFSGTVTLSSSSSAGRFSINSSLWSDTTIIALTDGDADFYYKDSSLGYITIMVSRTGFISASRTILSEIPIKMIPCNNVFNPAKSEKTTILYDIGSSGKVTIKVYNLIGELVKVLVDEEKSSGQGYSVDWKGDNSAGSTVASGVYLIHLQTNSGSITAKALVIK
jgi:hypothetical protein